MQTAGTKAGPMQIVVVALANALIIGGGVAFAHGATGVAVTLGVVAFSSLTFAVTNFRAAKE